MSDIHQTPTASSMASLFSNEQGIILNHIGTGKDNHNIGSNTNVLPEKTNSIKSCYQKIVKKIDFLKVEKRGIERVLPEDRTDLSIIDTALLWIGANTIIATFATGTLGPAVFKLSLYDTFLTIIIFNLIGIIPVAAITIFGPASGLRTMVFSRYSWGYYGASIISIINIITIFGYIALNSITGAQTLRVVFNDLFPISVGIIIISIVTMIISFVGYKWIHTYERYSWIPVFIAFCIVAIVSAKHFTYTEMASHNVTTSNDSNHRMKISRILNFGTVCFGVAASWCSTSADYNTYVPQDTSQLKIFLFTYIGNLLSLIPLELLGAAVYTGTYTNENWTRAYEIDNVGGLLGASLSSLGSFGKFLLIIFSLSTIACNIPNIYSLSLSAQVISQKLKHIPRIVYIVIGTIICTPLAIVTANNFNDALASIISVCSYWLSIYFVIVIEDHLLFRRWSFENYNFHDWNNRKVLPIGLAAILSALVGIVGIVLGMSQTWFSGPIAKAIAGNSGEHGADVGFELGFIFTAITFPLFRLIELYFVKR